MQVKHLLLLVVLILMIPPGFYYLMNSTTQLPKKKDPFAYEVVKTSPESIEVKISDSEPTQENPYYERFTEKIKQAPSWLVQDAKFQSCVTKSVENCVSNTTQMEAQLLQSDTLCDALPVAEAANCKNQFHHTKAIRTKDDSVCLEITNEFQRNACKNGVYTQRALETKDPRWCDRVTTTNSSASGLVSPEKQNCLNLLDLQRGSADSTFLNNNWEEGAIQETVLD